MEVFYTFKWAPKPRGNRRPQGGNQGERPQGERAERPQGNRGPRRDGAKAAGPQGERRDRQGKPGGPKKGGKPSSQAPKTFSARPEKKADPDSPFAVLAALKDKS
jgi:ATP-dependent RNA helicase SUPV3L1/SUV3